MAIVTVLLNGCLSIPTAPSLTVDERVALATSIATDTGLISKRYQTNGFTLQGYHRFTSKQEPLVVYIGGDGHAWERYGPSDDPTPMNPLALRLAGLDQSPNVLYLARPCQYVSDTCSVKYWTSHRMAKEVIDSYQQIITGVASHHGFSAVQLVGFSGGGGVAGLVAYQLKLNRQLRVESFRSVAGNLDHRYWTKELALIPMAGSLNASDIASRINDIPQLHFIGRNDRVISANISRRYQEQAGDTRCVTISEQQASHVRGWVALWSQLSKLKASCVH